MSLVLVGASLGYCVGPPSSEWKCSTRIHLAWCIYVHNPSRCQVWGLIDKRKISAGASARNDNAAGLTRENRA